MTDTHTHSHPGHRPPRDCPVCAHTLSVTALGCSSCGTEISGAFRSCAYCGLDDADLETLRVFLASRGNMRELERHLGVSYPTARQRFADLLGKLDITSGPPPVDRERVLADLASGAVSVDEAERLLTEAGAAE